MSEHHPITLKKITRTLFLVLFSLCFLTACTNPEPKKIYLVWPFDPEKGSWEGDWIRELLTSDKYEVEEVIANGKMVYLDHAIYVTQLNRDRKDLKEFFKTLHRKRYKFGIIQLSDEDYHQSSKCYRYAQFVLRNYWHEKFAKNPKVICFPLGYKMKFWADLPTKETKKAADRKYLWSFAGQIMKSSRMEMAENMKKISPFLLHETSNFNSEDALSVSKYRDLLINSVFAPCPCGWTNLDSFRLSEALEAGCIPIVEKKPFDYFGCLFEGKYPFLAVDSWDDVHALLNDASLSTPEQLEEKRQECMNWWHDQKEQLKRKIEEKVRLL